MIGIRNPDHLLVFLERSSLIRGQTPSRRSLLLLFRWGRIRTYLVMRGLSGERVSSVDRWLNPRRGNAGPAVEMDSERKGANLG
jgi:hypothetical protein